MKTSKDRQLRFSVAIDGEVYEKATILPRELLNELLIRKVLRYNRDGVYRWNIAGFISVGEIPYVVFPKSMTIAPSNEIECAKILMRTLYRYRNSTNLSVEEIDNFYGDGQQDSSTLGLALFFFDDYRRYGLINRTKEEYTRSESGAACWSKTVSNLQPVVTQGNVFYDKPYVHIKSDNTQAAIRKIHRFVIYDSMVNWGWIDDFEEMDLLSSESLEMSLEEAIRVLRNELRITYLHREILVIKNMMNYLRAKLDNKYSQIRDYYYTTTFHCAWEKICGVVLGNHYESLKNLIPDTSYIFENPEEKNKSLVQIPDILCEEEDDLIIFDAKYYDSKRGLPEWKDVMKQYIYRLSIKYNDDRGEAKYTNIYNAFLVPQLDNGKSTIAHIETENISQFGKIHVYGLSTYEMLDMYSRNDVSQMASFRNELVSDLRNKDNS